MRMCASSDLRSAHSSRVTRFINNLAFDELRTRQQLGYVVAAFVWCVLCDR